MTGDADNSDIYTFTASAEAMGGCMEAVKQISVRLRYFWRGCKLFMRATAFWTDGTSDVLFEEWHYGWRRILAHKIMDKAHIILMYLSGYRYGHNRGRHWDRKR
jgi:hypothetical protein